MHIANCGPEEVTKRTICLNNNNNSTESEEKEWGTEVLINYTHLAI